MDSRSLKAQASAVRDSSVPQMPVPPARAARERPTPPAEDPFPLGWRYRARKNEDGSEDIEQVPLTPEDLLNPQEGDVLSDGFAHNSSVLPLGDAMQRHHDGTNCAPDIAVIEKEDGGKIDTSELERAIKLRDVGARLVFALEAVSTSDKEVENKDIEKNVLRYAAHRVNEYLTYYPIKGGKAEKLAGRRLPKSGPDYDLIAPDGQERVRSKKLDLFFVIDKASQKLEAYDATTGEKLLTSEEEQAERRKAQAEREQAQAEREQAQAEREQAQAEREQAQAEQARTQRLLAEEAEARRKAEQEKQKAEQRTREMMAELERLRAR